MHVGLEEPGLQSKLDSMETHRSARRESLVVDAGGAQVVEAAGAERAVRAEDVARDQHVQHRVAQELRHATRTG